MMRPRIDAPFVIWTGGRARTEQCRLSDSYQHIYELTFQEKGVAVQLLWTAQVT
jgi:hypothetical protein